ncbi:hypothetical protein OC846_005237, partial [Tilletia horrida]
MPPIRTGPGRPRKDASEMAPIKRGPGRPRKDAGETAPVKRNSGHPREDAGEMPPVKRGPGRPRKDAYEARSVVSPPQQLTPRVNENECYSTNVPLAVPMSTTVKPTGLEPQLDLLTYNLIKPLLGKGIFKNLRPPSGALLSGPPGTGKTLLALHALSMNKIKCLHLRASDIHSKYTGVSEKTIAEAFDEARKSSPAVLLVELDNVRDQRVALIATTNCPDNIDPALLRRLPLTVKVPLPDTKARRDVIEAQLINRVKNRHKLTESHFMTLARLTEG